MDEDQQEIYDEGEIPLYCETCKHYTRSKHYKLINTKHPIKGWTSAITGTCPRCGSELQKVFPINRELYPLSNSITSLYNAGRLQDERFSCGKV